MKAKVVTFCTWTSIGSVLQAVGLKRALEQVGCDSTILLDRKANIFSVTKVRSLKSLISRMFQMLIHNKRKAAQNKRCGFMDKNLKIETYDNDSDLVKTQLESDADCYIAGSDQIWHPTQCNPVFFLDFVKDKKRIAYAASMGRTEIPEENRDKLKRMLNQFDRISVREEACRTVLGELTDAPIAVHVDPTFLVDAEQWRQYEREYPVREPYILLYMIYWNPACKAQIKALKKKTGLPVYAVCSALSRVYADKYLFDVGIEEFLWLVDHAEYVVTSSFHGAAFSVIFDKKFAPVINPAASSRMENLLSTLRIPQVRIEELDTAEFDYTSVHARIMQERARSIDYLKEAIAE